MMVNTACTFIFSVLSFYSFYRYSFQEDEFFKKLALLHFGWLSFFLTSTLTVIYTANLVASEVNIAKYKIRIEYLLSCHWFISFDREKEHLKYCTTLWTATVIQIWHWRYVIQTLSQETRISHKNQSIYFSERIINAI